MQNVFGLTPPEDPDRSGFSSARPARPEAFDLSRVISTFGRWFWEFVGVLALIVLLGLAYIALLRDPAFVSEARLFVRVSQEQTPPQTIFAGTDVSFLANSSGDVISEIDLFLNGDLVDKVIDAANLEALVSAPRIEPEGTLARIKFQATETMASIQSAVDEVLIAMRLKSRMTVREVLTEQIKQSIRVQNTTGSNVIVVGFQWGDRNVPQPLLQHYLDAFLDFRVDVFSTGEPAYFMNQREVAEAELARLSEDRARLRQQSGFHATETQRAQIVTLLETQRQELADLRNELDQARTRLAALAAAQGGEIALANVPGHPLLTALDERSVALIADIEGARAGPERIEILAKIDAVRAATEQALADYVETLAGRIAGSEAQIEALEMRLSDMADFEQEWTATERSLEIAEEQYQFFANRVNELQSLAELRQQRIGNIVVLQEPSAPRLEQRVRNKSLLIAIGVFGLISALAWIALREFLDDRLRTVDDVETLTGKPPLGILPRKAKGAQRRQAFSLAAAEIAPELKAARRNGGRSVLLYCAAATQPRQIEDDARLLAAAFDRFGFGPVQIVNLAGWKEKSRSAAKESKNQNVEHFTTEEDANGYLNECERTRAILREGDQALTILVSQPIELSPVAMRAAQLSDRVLLTLTAGKDTRREVERAVRRQVGTGVAIAGVIFSAARATLPRFMKADAI